jgi:hypothetical protein
MIRYAVPFLLLACIGCTAPLQGPPVELQTVLAPEPFPQPPPVPQPPPGPTAGPGTFRAWVPSESQPNGDRREGHWLVISTSPPAEEVLEPPVPLPRAPKTIYGQKPLEHARPPQSQATPVPVLPSGLQGLPRVPPQLQPPFGGQ